MVGKKEVWQSKNDLRIDIGLPDERLNAILTAMNNAVLVSITDKNGNITYANDKFVEISKYSKEELIGENYRILKSGYHPDSFYQELWDTISSGRVWRGEIKNKAKDGTFYWADSCISAIFNEFGDIEGYIAVIFLTTDRKEMEEKLRESEEILRIGLHSSSDIILERDIAKGYVKLIRNITTLQGQETIEIFGNEDALKEKANPKDQARIIDGFEKHMKHRNPLVLEYSIELKDGTRRYFSDRRSIILDKEGKPWKCVAVISDITEKKEAENKIRESEECLKQITGNISEVFWMTDPGKNQMVYISPGYEKIWEGHATAFIRTREAG